jgi:hypothetical protein
MLTQPRTFLFRGSEVLRKLLEDRYAYKAVDEGGIIQEVKKLHVKLLGDQRAELRTDLPVAVRKAKQAPDFLVAVLAAFGRKTHEEIWLDLDDMSVDHRAELGAMERMWK